MIKGITVINYAANKSIYNSYMKQTNKKEKVTMRCSPSKSNVNRVASKNLIVI